MNIRFSTQQSIRPPAASFTATLQPVEFVLDPGVVSDGQTVNDAVVFGTQFPTVRNDAEIVVDTPGAFPAYSTTDPAIATVDASGYVTSVGSGNVGIIARLKSTTRRFDHTAGVTTGENNLLVQNYVAGTLARHMVDEIAAILAAASDPRELEIFTSGTQRNGQLWTGELDLSGVAYSNSRSGNARRGATLISPVHVMMANHYRLSVGDRVTFVTLGGEPVERTIAAVATVSPVNNTDMAVGLLSEPVTECTYYAMLPSDWARWMTLYSNSDLPIIACKAAATRRAVYRYRVRYPFPTSSPAEQDTNNQRLVFHNPAAEASADIVSGDSGQPIFCPIGGRLTLLSSHTWDRSGFAYSFFRSEIDSVMQALGGGYSTSTVDLSGFTDF